MGVRFAVITTASACVILRRVATMTAYDSIERGAADECEPLRGRRSRTFTLTRLLVVCGAVGVCAIGATTALNTHLVNTHEDYPEGAQFAGLSASLRSIQKSRKAVLFKKYDRPAVEDARRRRHRETGFGPVLVVARDEKAEKRFKRGPKPAAASKADKKLVVLTEAEKAEKRFQKLEEKLEKKLEEKLEKKLEEKLEKGLKKLTADKKLVVLTEAAKEAAKDAAKAAKAAKEAAKAEADAKAKADAQTVADAKAKADAQTEADAMGADRCQANLESTPRQRMKKLLMLCSKKKIHSARLQSKLLLQTRLQLPRRSRA